MVLAVLDVGRRQDQLDLVVEAHDRDRVVGPQALGEQLEGVAHQGGPVAHGHAARPVDDQGQVHRRPLLGRHLAGGHGDPHHLAQRAGAGPDARLGAHGEVGLGRRRVAVVEGVDPLLRAHRLRRRAHAIGDEGLRHAVGAVVHVEGERRPRVGGGVDGPADALVLEGVAVRAARGRGRLLDVAALGRPGPRPHQGCRRHLPRRRSGRARSPARWGSRWLRSRVVMWRGRGFAERRSVIQRAGGGSLPVRHAHVMGAPRHGTSTRSSTSSSSDRFHRVR